MMNLKWLWVSWKEVFSRQAEMWFGTSEKKPGVLVLGIICMEAVAEANIGKVGFMQSEKQTKLSTSGKH